MNLEEVIAYLQAKKGPVAIPTETVWGLAAPISDEKSIQKIYTLKKRPKEKPLSVLIANYEQFQKLSPSSFSLGKEFWPGPLTLIVESRSSVPETFRANLLSIGIRMPNHPKLLELIERVGPLATPSANLSGENPALTSEEVKNIFGADFPLLSLDLVPQGIPSTIVSIVGEKKILREGAISRKMIELFI